MNNMNKIKAHFMHNDQGIAKAQIAKQFDVSPSTVSRWIKDVEDAKVRSKTIVVIDEQEPENEIQPKVVKRRNVWTFTPTKVERKQKSEQIQKQQEQMPQTAMSMAFYKAVNAC